MDKGFEITWGSLWRVFLMLFFAWVLYLARDVFISVILAVIVSSAFDPPVSFMERKKIPRVIGTIGLFLFAVLVIALVAYTVVPLAIFEINQLLTNLSKASGTVFDILQSSDAIESINKGLNSLSNALISGNTSLVDIGAGFLGGAFLALSVFVLSFYLTVGKDGVEKFLLAIIPQAYEAQVLSVYLTVRRKIGHWFEGQVFLSLGMGLMVFLGLWLLGVKYSLTLGILAGILELVPFVGPIFAGSIAVLVGVGESVTLGIYVLALFIVFQQIEGHLLVPLVTRFTTSLNPAVVIIALLVGGETLGFVGLVVAVPAAVFLQEIVENWTQYKARRRVTA
ncbi:MAG: AI-2E family transporter [Candidatus Harrisonbacteria bacterium]|nr:AI-2E family transporter [Candidatus Harrisonbacteria bacterium]